MKHNKKNFFNKIGCLFTATLFLMTILLVMLPGTKALTLCLAGGGVNGTSWDGVASGLDSYEGVNSNYLSWYNTGSVNAFETSTNNPLSAPNSFHINYKGGGKGFTNLTENFEYIYQINFSYWLYDSDSQFSGIDYLYAYFNDSQGHTIILLKWETRSNRNYLYWYDVSYGDRTLLSSSSMPNERYYLIITHNGTNQFNIKLENSGFGIITQLDCAGAYANDYTSFSNIFWNYASNGAANGDIYLDNFYINTTGITSPDEGDVSGFYEMCESTSGIGYDEILNSRYVENKFNFLFNGFIKGVDLKISMDQCNLIGCDLFDYNCTVNGLDIGSPDYLVADGSNYVLRWLGFNKTVSYDQPVFEFACNDYADLGGSRVYWFGIGVGLSGGEYRYGNNSGAYGDGLYNQINVNIYGLSMCFYYENYSYVVPTGTKIFVNFIDSTTTTPVLGYNILVPSVVEGLSTYALMGVTSDLWSGAMPPFDETGLVSPVYADFINGNFYMLNFTDISGKINGETFYFNDMHEQFQWYSNQTFTFYLTRKDSNDGYNNKVVHCFEGLDVCAYLESDKSIYLYGETVRIRYKIPTTMILASAGQHTGNWWVCLFRDRPWWDFAPSTDTAVYKTLCVEDNQWHFFSYVPSDPADNVDNYECTIQEPSWWIFYQNLISLDNPLRFSVYKQGVFSPSGNITSISPSEPMLGQATTISFNANNDFQLKIKNVLNIGYDAYTSGVKPLGTASYVFYPQMFGYFSVELYVYNGMNYSLVDTDYFYTNSTSGDWGAFGTAEFLYIPYRRVIAGYDNVNVIYHALKNESLLEIKDSTNATYPASTIVNTTPGVLNIKLPTYAEIGQWNITLYGNGTHSANFYVIAEENNYCEFIKNVYIETDPFSVLVMHTKKIALEFYKNGVAEGTNYILQANELPISNILIPITNIKPSVGDWKMQMWEINNNIRVKKLAEANCKVIASPKNLVVGGNIYGFDLLGFIESLPLPVRYLIGGIVTLIITISPFLIMLYASAGSQIQKANLPSVVYLGLFIFGESLSVLLRFFDWWIIAITLTAIILGFALDWMRSHKSTEAE